MAGDRARVRSLLDEAVEALDEASIAFDEEYPAGPEPPTPGPVIRVQVGDNVQAALDQARHEGATLLLAIGNHKCNLKVVEDPEAKEVIITSDTEHLPAPGVRMTREYEPGLAFLQSANNLDPVIDYKLRSTGVNLIALGIRPLQKDRTMIVFGTDSMTDPAEQPTRVVHDRLLMLGDPERGQHRGVMAHVRGYVLSNSSLLDMHEEGRDSQCVAAWNGGQYHVLRNNCFEASAENILYGGGSARTDAMAPQQVLIERNDFTKNPAWSSLEHHPNIKCLLEVKHLRHAVIRDNRFTHCWKAAWPTGVAIVIKCCDQSGKEPWTLTEDILLERNRVSKVGMFLSVVGKNDSGMPTLLMQTLTVRHNLVYDLDVDQWQGDGYAMNISNFPDDFTLDHNTILGNTKGITQFNFNDPARGQNFRMTNQAIWQGAYGIKGPSGMNAWDWATDLGYAPTVSGNAIRRHPDRTLDFGPGNTIIKEADFDASLDASADYCVRPGSAVAAVATTDGQPIGCDVTRLPSL